MVRTLLLLSSAIEALTGIALIATPSLVGRVLLGVELPGSAIAVARVAGFGLLALGIGCWPRGDAATAQSIRALFTYNLLAGIFLGYLRVGGGFSGFLLLPASLLHVILALLMARPALNTFQCVGPANRYSIRQSGRSIYRFAGDFWAFESLLPSYSSLRNPVFTNQQRRSANSVTSRRIPLC